MSGRIGIDFGTSNSVVARYDEVRQLAEPLRIPEIGVDKRLGDDVMNVVPSLVHYADEQTVWFGAQVLQRNLYHDNHTFKLMKSVVSRRSGNIPRKLADDRMISPLRAAEDLVRRLLEDALAELDSADEEVAFSVPVESFEHYDKWLREVAEGVGLYRIRLIDEASAAALGYGVSIQPGDVYLVFDFGGGTLDVSVVRIEEDGNGSAGRQCRVLGKSGAHVGGSTIDSWLFELVLSRNGRSSSDEDVRRLGNELLVACESAKEALSAGPEADITAQDPVTGKVLQATVTRENLEDLLDEHNLFSDIERVISGAIGKAREKGFDEDAIKQVLLVGGSSMIPAVQKQITRRFGKDRVALSEPLTAVAKGAAAFVAGVDFFDHIQHDYAIRHVNANSGAYEYRTLVRSGTAYPTDEAVDEVTVKASYDGQQELGIAIYELAGRQVQDATQPVELVFDSSGAPRMVEVSVDERHQRSHFWMNEEAPTFLRAEPPGRRGETRFRVEFHIDRGKRLLITAEDLRTRKLLFDQTPVVKLT
jgi:molecular chaperone DnaK